MYSTYCIQVPTVNDLSYTRKYDVPQQEGNNVCLKSCKLSCWQCFTSRRQVKYSIDYTDEWAILTYKYTRKDTWKVRMYVGREVAKACNLKRINLTEDFEWKRHTHLLFQSLAFITLTMELLSRRRWRLVWAQLSIKFGYSPWCNVPIVLHFQKRNSFISLPHLVFAFVAIWI